MLTRALIVVLAVLNASVALWWMLRSEPQAASPPPPPAGVAELEFLRAGQAAAVAPAAVAGDEAEAGLSDAAVAAEAEPAATEPTPELEAKVAVPAAPAAAAKVEPAPAERCAAFGPFNAEAAARAAAQRLGDALDQHRVRSQKVAAGNATYRVMLPPAASREQAQATVERIKAAGLGDYYIIAQGAQANAIALGQYRNREGAQRRLAAVQAAGFPAQLDGGGETIQWWLQGRLAGPGSANRLRQRAGASRQRSLDCAALR